MEIIMSACNQIKVLMCIVWLLTLNEPSLTMSVTNTTNDQARQATKEGLLGPEGKFLIKLPRASFNLSLPMTRSARLNALRFGLGRQKVSPLYLINGTVCRFINFQPVCTTLSTTGLLRGQAGGASGGGGGGGGGSSSGGGGGSSGGGRGGSSGGGGGGSGGSSGVSGGASRPSTAGVSSGIGSSVQFANQASRLSSLDSLNSSTQDSLSNELDLPIDSSSIVRGQQPMGALGAPTSPLAPLQPVNLFVNRRPFVGLFPFRRPQYQLVSANGRGDQQAIHRSGQASKS